MEERKGLHSLVSNVPWCSWSHLKTHRVVHRENKQMNCWHWWKKLSWPLRSLLTLITAPWGRAGTGEVSGEPNVSRCSLWESASAHNQHWERGSPHSPPNAGNHRKRQLWSQIPGSFSQHPSLPNTHSLTLVRRTQQSWTAKSWMT